MLEAIGSVVGSWRDGVVEKLVGECEKKLEKSKKKKNGYGVVQ